MKLNSVLYHVDRDSHVATVTLNRPERLNAIDRDVMADILAVCQEIGRDEDVRVAIWTGNGRGFCSGADVKGGGAPPPEQTPPLNERLDEESWISRQGKALYAVDKPMIAAVNGVAAGAGFSLTLCCDLRVGSEHARFVEAYNAVNLPPEGGMSFLLSRIVGLGRAMEITLTRKHIDAQEAYRIGLLDRLVPHDELLSSARELAAAICELPPTSVRVTKRAVRRGLEATFEQASANETTYGLIARRAAAAEQE